jgi:hypothetical protein
MKDFGRTETIKHIWIDLDSQAHPEVFLHIFRKQINNKKEEPKIIVIEESGFLSENPTMFVMTRKEFKAEYEIDVPELFEDDNP